MLFHVLFVDFAPFCFIIAVFAAGMLYPIAATERVSNIVVEGGVAAVVVVVVVVVLVSRRAEWGIVTGLGAGSRFLHHQTNLHSTATSPASLHIHLPVSVLSRTFATDR